MVARASQIVVESLVSGGAARASQVVLEVGVTRGVGYAAASQLVLEVLVAVSESHVPLVYPQLPGLSYSWIRRPIWSTGLATGASGREVRVGYWSEPLWEWELTYEYLPDFQGNGLTASDLRTLLGFFGQTYGRLAGFYFLDSDDCTVTGQQIGIGNGATQTFPAVRTLGGETEGIGSVVPGTPFALYLNGVVQDPSSYVVNYSVPKNVTITFVGIPPPGTVITVDMQYYFYVRFKEDQVDFEKFMNKLWLQKTITLRSLRS